MFSCFIIRCYSFRIAFPYASDLFLISYMFVIFVLHFSEIFLDMFIYSYPELATARPIRVLSRPIKAFITPIMAYQGLLKTYKPPKKLVLYDMLFFLIGCLFSKSLPWNYLKTSQNPPKSLTTMFQKLIQISSEIVPKPSFNSSNKPQLLFTARCSRIDHNLTTICILALAFDCRFQTWQYHPQAGFIS